MRNLMPVFPREICFPKRKLVRTESEFYDIVNKSNKLKDVYFSLYPCNKNRNFENTLINKIYFDFDIEMKLPSQKVMNEEMKEYYKKEITENATVMYRQMQFEILIKEVLKISSYFKDRDLKHLICFSGKKGFHVYLFAGKYENIVHKKDTIYNTIKYFKDTLKIHPDEHCKDLRRISRVPNTWHMTGKRYCIPVSLSDLYKGIDYIKEKAKEQCFDFRYYGNQLFDVSQFDYKTVFATELDIPEFEYDIDEDKAIKRFLPCVQCWLKNIDELGNWKARYYFVVYCRDLSLPKTMCNGFARKYFSKIKRKDSLANNYEHFKVFKTLEYGYSRGDLFPNCNTLFEEGLCKGKCHLYNGKGSPLYK